MIMHHPLLLADGSNATTASTTALDHSVDGRDAPPASPTALSLPANGSNLPEEGDAKDAGSIGNEVGPAGDVATATPSIPPSCATIKLLSNVLTRKCANWAVTGNDCHGTNHDGRFIRA